ncbi:EamA family transporter [Nocardioides korecus]
MSASTFLTSRAATRGNPARDGMAMAVTSMLCVQVGLALSIGLFDRLGPEGAGWVRLVWAGVLMLALGRPWRLRLSRRALAAATGLGVGIAGLSLLFMAAVARLPLGTASAVEFLGPLSIAVLHGRGRHRFTWPLLAGAGVVLLTRPWTGEADPVGLAFALAAAVCWAAYIVLSQRVGDEIAGIRGLAVAMPVAAVVATVAVGPASLERMTPDLWLVGLALAVLMPVVPFALEMLALQRLTTAAFGTLMSLEPAVALLVGALLLGQVPGPVAVLGMVLVVAAGIGAERGGGRPDPVDPAGPGDLVPEAPETLPGPADLVRAC